MNLTLFTLMHLSRIKRLFSGTRVVVLTDRPEMQEEVATGLKNWNIELASGDAHAVIVNRLADMEEVRSYLTDGPTLVVDATGMLDETSLPLHIKLVRYE